MSLTPKYVDDKSRDSRNLKFPRKYVDILKALRDKFRCLMLINLLSTKYLIAFTDIPVDSKLRLIKFAMKVDWNSSRKPELEMSLFWMFKSDKLTKFERDK